jgi:hypothetical protein
LLLADATDCDMIGNLATEPAKRELFRRLAADLRQMVADIDAAIAASGEGRERQARKARDPNEKPLPLGRGQGLTRAGSLGAKPGFEATATDLRRKADIFAQAEERTRPLQGTARLSRFRSQNVEFAVWRLTNVPFQRKREATRGGKRSQAITSPRRCRSEHDRPHQPSMKSFCRPPALPIDRFLKIAALPWC